jgi:hypothetical protein
VRKQNDRMEAAFKSLRGIYSDELIDLARWCLDMDLTKRPQSVFALQKAMVDRINEESRPPWMARMLSSVKHALGSKRGAEAIVKSTKKGPGTTALWGKKKQQESDKAIN